MGDDEVTQRIELACPSCGQASRPLRACEPPPARTMLRVECMFSGPHERPLWHWCQRLSRYVQDWGHPALTG